MAVLSSEICREMATTVKKTMKMRDLLSKPWP
jgi:hypothetical protein